MDLIITDLIITDLIVTDLIITDLVTTDLIIRPGSTNVGARYEVGVAGWRGGGVVVLGHRPSAPVIWDVARRLDQGERRGEERCEERCEKRREEERCAARGGARSRSRRGGTRGQDSRAGLGLRSGKELDRGT